MPTKPVKRYRAIAEYYDAENARHPMADQDRALQVVRRHLKPRGRLWLDVFNPDPKMLAREVAVGLDPCAFYVPRYDRTVFMTTEIRRRNDRPQVQQVTFRYAWFDR